MQTNMHVGGGFYTPTCPKKIAAAKSATAIITSRQ